jgi:hypothetical protein
VRIVVIPLEKPPGQPRRSRPVSKRDFRLRITRHHPSVSTRAHESWRDRRRHSWAANETCGEGIRLPVMAYRMPSRVTRASAAEQRGVSNGKESSASPRSEARPTAKAADGTTRSSANKLARIHKRLKRSRPLGMTALRRGLRIRRTTTLLPGNGVAGVTPAQEDFFTRRMLRRSKEWWRQSNRE